MAEYKWKLAKFIPARLIGVCVLVFCPGDKKKIIRCQFTATWNGSYWVDWTQADDDKKLRCKPSHYKELDDGPKRKSK